MFALGACAVQGPPTTSVGRQIVWYGYLAGDDIRRACGNGAVDRIRFVYQATYARQVRGYELTGAPGADIAGLRSQAWGSPTLLSFERGAPSIGSPVEARLMLDRRQIADLHQAVAASGFDGRPPVGAFLRSDRYFWTVAACRNGRFHFNAYPLDAANPRQPPFAAALFALDNTGVPVRQPVSTGGPLITRDPDHASPQGREDLTYQVRVGPEGLETGFP
jgi:hypothetical protein